MPVSLTSTDESLSLEEVGALLKNLTVNSTAAYILSFLVVYCIYHFSNGIVASFWDIGNTLYFYGVDFSQYRGSWNRPSVITIYGTGPSLCLLWSLLNFRLYFRTYKKPGNLKLFHAWSILHGITMFFGAAAVGVFTKSGFGYAIKWAYLPYIACLIIAAVAIVLMLIIGLRYINFFMYASPSTQLIDDDYDKRKFVLNTVLYPFIIGTGILLLWLTPHLLQPSLLPEPNVLIVLSPAIMVLPLWARSLNNHARYGIAAQPAYKIAWPMVVLTLCLLIGIRLGLENGLQLGELKTIQTQNVR